MNHCKMHNDWNNVGTCEDCGEDLSDSLKVCAHCGFSFIDWSDNCGRTHCEDCGEDLRDTIPAPPIFEEPSGIEALDEQFWLSAIRLLEASDTLFLANDLKSVIRAADDAAQALTAIQCVLSTLPREVR